MGKNRIIDAIASAEKIKAGQQIDYNHQVSLNMALKAIWMSPLNDDVKKLMILRIWGRSSEIWYPLETKDCAFELLGHIPDEQEMIAFTNMELFGKQQVAIFLHENQNIQEMIDRFNLDFERNKRHMFAKRTFEKKRMQI